MDAKEGGAAPLASNIVELEGSPPRADGGGGKRASVSSVAAKEFTKAASEAVAAPSRSWPGPLMLRRTSPRASPQASPLLSQSSTTAATAKGRGMGRGILGGVAAAAAAAAASLPREFCFKRGGAGTTNTSARASLFSAAASGARSSLLSCSDALSSLRVVDVARIVGEVAFFAARLVVCLAMSYGGLSNRIAFGGGGGGGGGGSETTSASSELRWSVASDAACAAAENWIVLSAWESWARRRFLPAAGPGSSGSLNRSPSSTSKAARPHGSSVVAAAFAGRRRSNVFFRRCVRRIDVCLRGILFAFLAMAWLFGSWGDYVFQVESSGMLPTIWVVAPGLRDPVLHAGVQMRTKGDVFWGGLVKVTHGLVVGIFGWSVLSWVHWGICRRTDHERGKMKKRYSDPDCSDCGKVRRRHNDNAKRYCWKCRKRNAVACFVLRNPVALMATVVLVLFSTGSWSPMTNLIYCAVGSLVLVPPGGGRIDPTVLEKKRAKVLEERGIPTYADDEVASEKGESAATGSSARLRPPNVIMVVHESLGGAALEGKRGRDAAPYWHNTLKSDPDFYSFSHGRATAGVTPIATPAIMTGLLPYSDNGCLTELEAATLGHEFGSAGYDTGSFVSYGHDWAGGTWAVIDKLVKPGFDYLAGPKQTGEPVVNEYGMDDRVLLQYLRKWMADRGRASATPSANAALADNGVKDAGATAAAAESQRKATSMLRGASSDAVDSGSSIAKNAKPFFALIIFNNNHFPHLQHENYTAVPSECFDVTNSENDTTKDCEDRFSNPWGDDAVEGTNLMFADGDSFDDCDYYNNWNDPPKKYYYVNGEAYDCEGDAGHYYSSIRTMDESLEAIFDALEEAGELNNTIVVGAGDHGETPGNIKRLSDVDAPILQVPIWMRVPRELLPDRASITSQTDSSDSRSGRAQLNGTQHNSSHAPIDADTYLRSNVNKTISVLDIMPTLRDILNYTRVFTQNETDMCLTGTSLLSTTLPDQRVVPGWQGWPLFPGQAIGIFMNRSEALVHYEGEHWRSHIADFKFDENDPIFTLYERRGEDWTEEERKGWAKVLREDGWLDDGTGVQGPQSEFVSRSLPSLDTVFEDVVNPWQPYDYGEYLMGDDEMVGDETELTEEDETGVVGEEEVESTEMYESHPDA